MGTLSEQLEKYFSETPKNILDLDWKSMEPLNEIGPDVLAMLSGSGNIMQIFYQLKIL